MVGTVGMIRPVSGIEKSDAAVLVTPPIVCWVKLGYMPLGVVALPASLTVVEIASTGSSDPIMVNVTF